MTTLNRSEINRALAKAIAYKQCGKDEKAQLWAARLVGLLDCYGILDLDDNRISQAAQKDPAQ